MNKKSTVRKFVRIRKKRFSTPIVELILQLMWRVDVPLYLKAPLYTWSTRTMHINLTRHAVLYWLCFTVDTLFGAYASECYSMTALFIFSTIFCQINIDAAEQRIRLLLQFGSADSRASQVWILMTITCLFQNHLNNYTLCAIIYRVVVL